MADFKNNFSWSWSRKSTFDRCKRKYWYQHYGFWGGWDRNASADCRQLYIEKKLQNRAQSLGIHVHETIEWLLKSIRAGTYPTPEQAASRCQNRLNRQIEDSKHGRYQINPKRFPGFSEHYFGLVEDD